MIRVIRAIASLSILLAFVAGCVANINAPQTRGEFVESMKPGGMFRNVDKATLNRPYKAVVADLTEYANKCLNVRVTRAASYTYKEVGGSTTYHPKIETTGKEAAALSVQEEYGNKQANSGAPRGGIFVLVAEVRAAGANKTQLDIYHLSRGQIADPLKQWAAGDKRQCPSFSGAL